MTEAEAKRLAAIYDACREPLPEPTPKRATLEELFDMAEKRAEKLGTIVPDRGLKLGKR